MKQVKIKLLKGNGSFASEECLAILKEADVVVTNPPFSLFREYFKLLMENDKKFIIIGNQTAFSYKELFPYFKNNIVYLGYSMNGSNRWFFAPDKYEVNEKAAGYKVVNGKNMFFVNGVAWFTNLREQYPEPLTLSATYSSDKYPKYKNYDAIEVSRVKNIPMDYEGIMGVPITFLYKYCPTQFEFLGLLRPYLNGKALFARFLIKRRQNGLKNAE